MPSSSPRPTQGYRLDRGYKGQELLPWEMLSPGGVLGPWQLFESLGPWQGGQWSGKTSITRNGVLRTDLVKLGLEQVTQLLLSLSVQQSFAAALPSPVQAGKLKPCS